MKTFAPDSVASLGSVSFAYEGAEGASSFSLRDVSFEFRRGEVSALLGRSGVGKTTLVQIAAGLLAPQEGVVQRAEGVAVGAACVFQNPRLVPWLSVRENVEFTAGDSRLSADRERMERMLADLGLSDAAASRPHELSGGMRQRCAFARALISDHPLLILDEPFSGTDFLLRETLYRMVRQEADAGRAVVLITHDIHEALRLADHILVLGGNPSRIRDRIEFPPIACGERTPENRAFRDAAADLEQRIRKCFIEPAA